MLDYYDKRSILASGATILVADKFSAYRHPCRVLSSDDLLAELRRLRAAGETTNAAIQRLLGLPSSRVSEIFAGGRRIKADEAKVLMEHFGLADDVRQSDARRSVTTTPGSAGRELPDIPETHSVDAGEVASILRLDLSLPMGPGATVDDFVEGEPLSFDLAYVRSFTKTPPHRLRLAGGAGDSMFPTLVSHDLVWIDTTQNQLLHSDRIYAASINGGAAIKRLRPLAGGRRVLVISDNKTVDPYEVDASEVRIWGRVIRFARDL